MKARVKETGKIVEVVYNGFYYESIKDERIFDKIELEIIPKTKDSDYWTKLEHQYAGMAMQGILSNGEYLRSLMHTKHDDFRADEVVPSIAVRLSHALVEKLKEKEEK